MEWISVKERLPEPDELVITFPYSPVTIRHMKVGDGEPRWFFDAIPVTILELKEVIDFVLALTKKKKPQRHLYLVKAKEDEIGFLVAEKNHSYTIAFKGLYDRLQILEPCNARYAIHDDGNGNRFIKIQLPKFI